MAQGDIFGGDPLTGSGIYQLSDGTSVDTDLAHAFDGRFYISGGTLIDTSDPTSPLSLGRQGEFTLQDVGNGRYSLKTEIQLQNINRPSSAEVLRTIEGTVDVLQSDGTVSTLNIGSTAANQIGWQAVAYPREDGSTGITHVRGIYTSNAQVELALGLGWRLASPTEAVEAAVSRRLYLDNLDELKRIGEEEDITDDKGDVDLSGTIRWIMERTNMDNIDAFSQYLFE